MNQILEARENRSKHINKLIEEHKYKSIVVMKANVPGFDKNPKNMGFICHYFSELIDKTFKGKIIESNQVISMDGNYKYYVIEETGRIVKEKTILIEEKNLLGRLVDIDVFNEIAISRNDIACEMRKCLICDNYAHLCSRSKKHSDEEVFNAMNEIINDFLLHLILNKSVSSIYSELDLYPKFGLVSMHDSGCHEDMDSNTFIESIFAIKPFIKEFIMYGIKNLNDPFILKEIGVRAEKAMFKATMNINTHKGLIFALGVFLPAFTKAVLNQKGVEYVMDEIKHISTVIVGDYYETLSMKTQKTHGDHIYLSHKLKGVRGEALDGFSIIFDIPSFKDKLSYQRNHEYLIHLMSRLNDTTIIHRTDIETLNEVKATCKKIIESGGYSSNEETVEELSKQYMKRNISPGGSADLLVLKIVFEDLKYLLQSHKK